MRYKNERKDERRQELNEERGKEEIERDITLNEASKRPKSRPASNHRKNKKTRMEETFALYLNGARQWQPSIPWYLLRRTPRPAVQHQQQEYSSAPQAATAYDPIP